MAQSKITATKEEIVEIFDSNALFDSLLVQHCDLISDMLSEGFKGVSKMAEKELMLFIEEYGFEYEIIEELRRQRAAYDEWPELFITANKPKAKKAKVSKKK